MPRQYGMHIWHANMAGRYTGWAALHHWPVPGQSGTFGTTFLKAPLGRLKEPSSRPQSMQNRTTQFMQNRMKDLSLSLTVTHHPDLAHELPTRRNHINHTVHAERDQVVAAWGQRVKERHSLCRTESSGDFGNEVIRSLHQPQLPNECLNCKQ
jgi:hypothetical protein